MPDLTVREFDGSFVPLIVHGAGAVRRIRRLLDERGLRRALLVSPRTLIEKADPIDTLRFALGDRLVAVGPPIRAHTPPSDVTAVVRAAEDVEADVLVALGGSSVIDGAKVAALKLGGADPSVIVQDGTPRHAESGAEATPIPLIAVPTTLSAGEYRPSAGMVDAADGRKLLCEDARLRPAAVVLDPELTLYTPLPLWASSGVKAIDHAAETIWGTHAHPMGDALAAEALRRLARSLPRTVESPADLAARLDCQLAAWLSIHTMTNTLIHLSHALEHSMGGYWHLGHGITSCIVLPTVMGYLADVEPAKVALVARALDSELAGGGRSDTERARAGARWLEEFIGRLGVPTRLREVVTDLSGLDEVSRIATSELAFFGYVPPAGLATVRDLIARMW